MYINAKNLYHTYEYDGMEQYSLRNISFDIGKGEMVAVLGHNGCGKSTLAKHLNGLIPLQKGQLVVAGIDASERKRTWELCKTVGMVFQNPDNQFVSTVVEEDIAFGLRNYQIPEEEIHKRVKEALELVDMQGMEHKSPHMLSGGQKQRIALAGVLALRPDILILDEATSMLDPDGRQYFMEVIERIRAAGDTSIILITHYIEECINADRLIVMKNGGIATTGTPGEVLSDIKLLEDSGLKPPLSVEIYFDLRKKGYELKSCPLTIEELVENICQLL